MVVPTSVLNRASHAGDINEIKRLLSLESKGNGKPDSLSLFWAVYPVGSDAMSLTRAVQIVELISSGGARPSTDPRCHELNRALATFLTEADMCRAITALAEAGCKPDDKTFVHACAFKVEKIARHILSLNPPLNTDALNSALQAQLSMDVLEELCRKGCRPDGVTLQRVLQHKEKCAYIRLLVKYWQESERTNFLNRVIEAEALAEEFDPALILFLIQKGCKPQSSTVSFLLNPYMQGKLASEGVLTVLTILVDDGNVKISEKEAQSFQKDIKFLEESNEKSKRKAAVAQASGNTNWLNSLLARASSY